MTDEDGAQPLFDTSLLDQADDPGSDLMQTLAGSVKSEFLDHSAIVLANPFPGTLSCVPEAYLARADCRRAMAPIWSARSGVRFFTLTSRVKSSYRFGATFGPVSFLE